MPRKQSVSALHTLSQDPRWLALRARDASADGSFFYSVKTTGVYCRPSCASRTPRPENVEFHENRSAAERAGFRACRRCKPDLAPAATRSVEIVAAMCRLLEASEIAPRLEQLAGHVGSSPFHAHRLFKASTGLTPRAYWKSQQSRRVREELRRPGSVTQAIYGAGYGSAGRFYEQAPSRLGMTPSTYKAGGPAEKIRFALGECSLGTILVAATARGVCAISLGDDPQSLLSELEAQFPRAELLGADPEFETLVAQVVSLVERPKHGQRLPLDIRGTAFQERVWQALRSVPGGQRLTYAELAERIGRPNAVRAVANACGANRLAVAIPCHRVVRTGGGLSGYRWGVERKRLLLEREEEP